MSIYDVIIIGGGPAGATAALYTARAALKTLVIDMSKTSGALGKTSKIANYPGVPELLTGEELLSRMWKQAESHGAEFKKAKVSGTDFSGETKTIFISDGSIIESKSVILATGATSRGSVLPGESELLGRGVSYCATCDGAFFKDKEVLVYGDSDFAIEEAQFLSRFAKTVHFVSPKQKDFDNQPENMVIYQQTRVKSVIGAASVEGVEIVANGVESTISVDGVFIYMSGNQPVIDYLFGSAGTDEHVCVAVNSEYSTNMPGVFACGDITCHAVQQVVVAASQGCVAALSADKYLRGREKLKKDYK